MTYMHIAVRVTSGLARITVKLDANLLHELFVFLFKQRPLLEMVQGAH